MGFRRFARALNDAARPKEERGEGEGKKRLQTNPQLLKTCVRSQTRSLIGWLFKY